MRSRLGRVVPRTRRVPLVGIVAVVAACVALASLLASRQDDRPWVVAVGLAACVLALAGAIVAIVLARRDRSAHLLDQARLLLAQEEERKRVAAGIHDDPLQQLAALSLRLQRLARRTDDADLAVQLRELDAAAAGAAERLRHLLFELHPPTLEHDGLAPALDVLCREALAGTTTAGTVVDETSTPLSPAARALGYRATREVLLNARNHAQAAHVEIRLRTTGHLLEVQVRDDGRGFDPGVSATRRPGHLGLPHVTDLVEAAGGSVHVESAPGAGTRVTLVVPALATPTDGV